jgi:hypothetical protein
MVNAPELFGPFTDAHPDASVSYRELPFPSTPTSAWLEHVDVAFSVAPATERGVLIQAVRAEPRAVLVPDDHRLAQHSQVSASELMAEQFLAYHPHVQPAWAGLHSLDDLRGGPAPNMTDDHASTPPEMLTMMASRRGIAVLPLSDALVIRQVLRGVVAIPISDAGPMVLSLSALESNRNPCVQALVTNAQGLASRNGVAHVSGRSHTKGTSPRS